MVEKDLSFLWFLKIIWNNWRTFAIVGIAAIALASVFSGPTFIKPKFLSKATVYPVNLNSYSQESRTDQLLQLLESNSIRDSLITRFDLANAYEMDTTKDGGYFALYNEFKERVEISKTRYESVMIEILDEDPKVARDMVLEMLEQVNLLARRLQREKSREVERMALKAMHNERHKLDSIEARLNVLRQGNGLLAYEVQAKEVTKGYVKLLGTPSAGKAQKEQLEALMKELEEKGGEFRYLSELSDMFRRNYDRLLTEYEQAVNDVTKELTYTNVVVYPEVSDKKVYPIRWLIVLITLVAALTLCFALFIIKERSKGISGPA